MSSSVAAQINEWKHRLVDLTRRNHLLFFKEASRSAVELVHPDVAAIFDRIAQSQKSLSFFSLQLEPAAPGQITRSVRRPKDDEILIKERPSTANLKSVLKTLFRKSSSFFEEQGLRTLYLSFGQVSWTDSQTNTSATSPLVLVPVTLERTTAQNQFEVQGTDEEVLVNPAFQLYARQQFKFELPELDGDVEDIDIEHYLETVRKAVKKHNWTVQDNCWLSTFSFHKLVMYQDIASHADAMAKHPLINRLCESRNDRSPAQTISTPNLDVLNPRESFQVVEADSSQQACIQAVKEHQNLIIHGPPGTGKSQTITNIIAECIAAGKSVLFVSEKMAALDVVFNRLKSAQLDQFCLELHSQRASKKALIEELEYCYKKTIQPSGRFSNQEFEKLISNRAMLNQYAEELHRERQPLKLSIFEVVSELCARKNIQEVGFRFTKKNLTSANLQLLTDSSAKLAQIWHIARCPEEFSWNDCTFDAFDESRRDGIVRNLQEMRRLVNDLISLLEYFPCGCDNSEPSSIIEAKKTLELVRYLETGAVFSTSVLRTRDLRDITKALEIGAANRKDQKQRERLLLSVYDETILDFPAEDISSFVAALAEMKKARIFREHSAPQTVVEVLKYMEECELESQKLTVFEHTLEVMVQLEIAPRDAAFADIYKFSNAVTEFAPRVRALPQWMTPEGILDLQNVLREFQLEFEVRQSLVESVSEHYNLIPIDLGARFPEVSNAFAVGAQLLPSLNSKEVADVLSTPEFGKGSQSASESFGDLVTALDSAADDLGVPHPSTMDEARTFHGIVRAANELLSALRTANSSDSRPLRSWFVMGEESRRVSVLDEFKVACLAWQALHSPLQELYGEDWSRLTEWGPKANSAIANLVRSLRVEQLNLIEMLENADATREFVNGAVNLSILLENIAFISDELEQPDIATVLEIPGRLAQLECVAQVRQCIEAAGDFDLQRLTSWCDSIESKRELVDNLRTRIELRSNLRRTVLTYFSNDIFPYAFDMDRLDMALFSVEAAASEGGRKYTEYEVCNLVFDESFLLSFSDAATLLQQLAQCNRHAQSRFHFPEFTLHQIQELATSLEQAAFLKNLLSDPNYAHLDKEWFHPTSRVTIREDIARLSLIFEEHASLVAQIQHSYELTVVSLGEQYIATEQRIRDSQLTTNNLVDVELLCSNEFGESLDSLAASVKLIAEHTRKLRDLLGISFSDSIAGAIEYEVCANRLLQIRGVKSSWFTDPNEVLSSLTTLERIQRQSDSFLERLNSDFAVPYELLNGAVATLLSSLKVARAGLELRASDDETLDHCLRTSGAVARLEELYGEVRDSALRLSSAFWFPPPQRIGEVKTITRFIRLLLEFHSERFSVVWSYNLVRATVLQLMTEIERLTVEVEYETERVLTEFTTEVLAANVSEIIELYRNRFSSFTKVFFPSFHKLNATVQSFRRDRQRVEDPAASLLPVQNLIEKKRELESAWKELRSVAELTNIHQTDFEGLRRQFLRLDEIDSLKLFQSEESFERYLSHPDLASLLAKMKGCANDIDEWIVECGRLNGAIYSHNMDMRHEEKFATQDFSVNAEKLKCVSAALKAIVEEHTFLERQRLNRNGTLFTLLESVRGLNELKGRFSKLAPEYQAVLGSWFQGLDTDVSKVRTVISGVKDLGLTVQLTERIIENWSSQEFDYDALRQSQTVIARALRRISESTETCFALEYSNLPFDAALANIHGLRTDLHQVREVFEKLSSLRIEKPCNVSELLSDLAYLHEYNLRREEHFRMIKGIFIALQPFVRDYQSDLQLPLRLVSVIEDLERSLGGTLPAQTIEILSVANYDAEELLASAGRVRDIAQHVENNRAINFIDVNMSAAVSEVERTIEQVGGFLKHIHEELRKVEPVMLPSSEKSGEQRLTHLRALQKLRILEANDLNSWKRFEDELCPFFDKYASNAKGAAELVAQIDALSAAFGPQTPPAVLRLIIGETTGGLFDLLLECNDRFSMQVDWSSRFEMTSFLLSLNRSELLDNLENVISSGKDLQSSLDSFHRILSHERELPLVVEDIRNANSLVEMQVMSARSLTEVMALVGPLYKGFYTDCDKSKEVLGIAATIAHSIDQHRSFDALVPVLCDGLVDGERLNSSVTEIARILYDWSSSSSLFHEIAESSMSMTTVQSNLEALQTAQATFEEVCTLMRAQCSSLRSPIEYLSDLGAFHSILERDTALERMRSSMGSLFEKHAPASRDDVLELQDCAQHIVRLQSYFPSSEVPEKLIACLCNPQLDLETVRAPFEKVGDVGQLTFVKSDSSKISLSRWVAELDDLRRDLSNLRNYASSIQYHVKSGNGDRLMKDMERDLSELVAIRAIGIELSNRASSISKEFPSEFDSKGEDFWDTCLANLAWLERLRRQFKFEDLPGWIVSYLNSSVPREEENFDNLARVLTELQGSILMVKSYFSTVRNADFDWKGLPLAEVAELLMMLEKQVDLIPDWLLYLRIKQDWRDAGVGNLSNYVCGNPQIEPEVLQDVVLKTFFQDALTKMLAEDPVLSNFDSADLAAAANQFCASDQSLILAGASRISAKRNQMKVPEPLVGGEAAILLREAEKKARYLPVRKLLQEIPGLLRTLKPCLMMSPLSAAQFIDPTLMPFDLVIFDEASQICPEDAVGAIFRAKQVVVCGDEKQLPPTSFFEKMDSSDEELTDEDLSDSILEKFRKTGIAQSWLKWHYRSKHESLISFSNQEFYDDKLVVFPSPTRTNPLLGVRHEYVEDGVYDRAGRKNNEKEARRVADLVVHHWLTHPKRSLGVIAFSTAQQNEIEDQIERKIEERPELSKFTEDHGLNGFFVKNLENSQGDERDVIIFSVGYGRAADGKLSMNFGPLNKQGGERRLNVAITRAREQVILVSSIRAEELTLKDSKSKGLAAFCNYLSYAEAGGYCQDTAIGLLEQTYCPMIWDLQLTMAKRGYEVHRSVGSSEMVVDLAIAHSDKPDHFVLGIQCDGKSYKSAVTCRDRDRLRLQVLEQKGWRIHKVWALDWLSDKEKQADLIESVIAKSSSNTTMRTSMKVADPKIEDRFDDIEVLIIPDWVYYYSIAKVSHKATRDELVDFESRKRLVLLVREICEQEAPIHVSVIAKRVVSVWSSASTRLTPKRTEAIENAIRVCCEQGLMVQRGSFVHLKSDEDEIMVRTVNPQDPDTRRTIDEIDDSEIEAALVNYVRDCLSVDSETLVKQVAKVFGFERVGDTIRESLERVTQRCIKKKSLRMRGNKVIACD
ncbi:MAG: DUF4011 domain-containing protein [Candidatus Obscuribacterales bacterium]|nr:DUF4011 domain-containing protein [Candidatus Obscuribacterales bacterium]